MKTKTAAEQRIRSLFHYQSFDDPERLARILIDQLIYCSNPKDFNDPWDCRPCFSKSVLDDPVQYERVLQQLVQSSRKRDPLIPATEHARRVQVLRSDRPLLERMIDQMTEAIEKAVFAQYRVYCLTPDPDAPLMWSHYARAHQGICLEFSVENDLVCGALPVEYLSHYPEFNLADNDEDASLRPLLTKSEIWRYEREYRLVVAAPGYSSPGVLPTRDNFVALPPGALKAIIMGCLMPERDREAIHTLIKDSGTSVALRAARRVANLYALEIFEAN
jgi:hypothetical protein